MVNCSVSKKCNNYFKKGEYEKCFKSCFVAYEHHTVAKHGFFNNSCIPFISLLMRLFKKIALLIKSSINDYDKTLLLFFYSSIIKCIKLNIKGFRNREMTEGIISSKNWNLQFNSTYYFIYLIHSIYRKLSVNQIQNLESVIEQVVDLKIKNKGLEYSFLHFSINSKKFKIKKRKFGIKSSLLILESFLKCGANVNTIDIFGRTLLHCINEINTSKAKKYAFIKLLIRYNVHLDQRDCIGNQALNLYTFPKIRKYVGCTLLKCIAANAIIKHKIKYKKTNLPKNLMIFIEKHFRFGWIYDHYL